MQEIINVQVKHRHVQYPGTSTTECENFPGYQSATVRVKCWCIKSCTQATGMTDTVGCEYFLTGCVYDSNDSCVDKNAECTSLKYKTNANECQSMTDAEDTQKCWNGIGTNCKKRVRSDAITKYVKHFVTGCVTKGLNVQILLLMDMFEVVSKARGLRMRHLLHMTHVIHIQQVMYYIWSCLCYIRNLFNIYQIICTATTTETSKKCKWEGITCRQQKCSDLTGANDEECNGKLAGCKSNDTSCIGPNLNCSVFNGAEKLRLIDSYGQPCLYQEGTCYADDNCTDITTASGDPATCLSNRSYKYTESTKNCETTDCKTFTPTGTCEPIPSFDVKTYTICTSTANGCTAGDPTTLAQADCFSQVSRYTYTWNAGISKCQSCKDSSSTINNTNNGNTTTNTTTDSGYVLGVSMALAILGFMA